MAQRVELSTANMPGSCNHRIDTILRKGPLNLIDIWTSILEIIICDFGMSCVLESQVGSSELGIRDLLVAFSYSGCLECPW